MAGAPPAEIGGSESGALLREGAAALGLQLTAVQLQQFATYSALLQAGKQTHNLTALTDPADIELKHFVDSISVLSALPADAKNVVDVGTGAGFPGLPIKIVRPNLSVTLLEATAKKADWVRGTAQALHLDAVQVVAGRAEDLGHEPRYRAQFDVAVARAVAPLAVLAELCLPFVKPGGCFIAMKTSTALEVELPQSERALSLLGGRIQDVRTLEVNGLPNRALVVVEQLRPVPAQYPRRPGVPSKRPLQRC